MPCFHTIGVRIYITAQEAAQDVNPPPKCLDLTFETVHDADADRI